MIGRRGRTLDALEYLVNRIAFRDEVSTDPGSRSTSRGTGNGVQKPSRSLPGKPHRRSHPAATG